MEINSIEELKNKNKNLRKEFYKEKIETGDVNTLFKLRNEANLMLYPQTIKTRLIKFTLKLNGFLPIKPKLARIIEELTNAETLAELVNSISTGEAPWAAASSIFKYERAPKEAFYLFEKWEELYINAVNIAIQGNGTGEGEAIEYLVEKIKKLGLTPNEQFNENVKFNIAYARKYGPAFNIIKRSLMSDEEKTKTYNPQNSDNLNARELGKPLVKNKNDNDSTYVLEYLEELKKNYESFDEKEKKRAIKRILREYENEDNSKIKVKILKTARNLGIKEVVLYLSKQVSEKDNVNLRKEALRGIFEFSDKGELFLHMLKLGSGFVKSEERKKAPLITSEELKKQFESLSNEDKELIKSKINFYLKNKRVDYRIKNRTIEFIGIMKMKEYKNSLVQLIGNSKKSTIKAIALTISRLCE